MKKTLVPLALIGLLSVSANAAVLLNTTFGAMRDSTDAVVADGIRMVMIVDNGDGVFPGGMALNSTTATLNPSLVTAAWEGQSLAVGSIIGGDTVFWSGTLDSLGTSGVAGIWAGAETLLLGSNGLVAGRPYAFAWFPQTTGLTATADMGGLFQVGAVSYTDPAQLGGDPLAAMVVPADGQVFSPTVVDTENGGTLPAGSWSASPVPEASTALLGLIGLAGLVRRRR